MVSVSGEILEKKYRNTTEKLKSWNFASFFPNE